MILERLKQYIDFKGISIAAFERSIGMSNASFGKSLKNHRAIGTDKLENILSVYPDISPLWLLKGVGDMLLPNPDNPEYPLSQTPSYLLTMIKDKDDTIRQQAEELGQLREQLSQCFREIEQWKTGKNVTAVRHAKGTVKTAL